MSTYRKPYVEGVFKKDRSNVVYPYSDSLLREHDIFPLFVLDGGASFSTNERLGGLTGQHFLDGLDDGSMLKPWRVGKRIVWDRVYDQTINSPCQTMLEQHVWMNRLYFLLPIAQRFFRTRDEQWAQAWFDYFSDWVKSNPYKNEGQPGARLLTKYTWFDMQIVWRLLVIVHSVKLLGASKTLKRKQWHFIYNAIEMHSRNVFREASISLEKKTGHGNHFLQQGTALIYTGILFPGLANAQKFIEVGRGIIVDQLTREILPDGGSIEGSPSYSHFIARLYLDVYLLLKDNKLPGIPKLEQGIKKQYRQLAALATPAGRTLQVSDSYSLDVKKDLQIVNELFPIPTSSPKRSVCFRDSQMMVLRNRRCSVYVDAMPNLSHHIHAGKPNVMMHVGDEQLLLDSGCSSYDRELWMDWYRQADSHNVVTVTPAGAGRPDPYGTPIVPEIIIKKFTSNKTVIEHRAKDGKFSYTWTRIISLADRAVTIEDRVVASSAADVSQIWHVSPVNFKVLKGDKRAVAQLQQGDVVFDQIAGHGGGKFKLSHTPAIGPDNRVCAANRLVSEARGKRVTMKIKIGLPSA